MHTTERMRTPVARVLRVALAACFFGHGVLALLVNPSWFSLYAAVGLDEAFARATMPLVGVLDLAIVLALLVRPVLPILAWCVFWTLLTATLRPLSGTGIGELVVRAMNFGPAIALVMLALPASTRAVRVWLAVAFAMIVVGTVLGGSLVPKNITSVLDWVERAGAIGVPLALALSFRQRPNAS